MRKVSKDEFFAAVGNRDAHPISGPERDVWEDQKTRQILGYTYPGYLMRNVLGKYQAETTFFLPDPPEAQDE